MSDLLESLKNDLQASDFTCIIQKNDQIYTSHERGVKPLLSWLDVGMDFSGYSAADRVVGNGAAFLYALLNIKEVYASVLSKSAAETLERYHIRVAYDVLVDTIQNRTGTGRCPIEDAVDGETVATEALKKIRNRLAELAPLVRSATETSI